MIKFATLETIITSITDVSPLAKKHKTLLIFLMCTGLYLLGLPYCTRVSNLLKNPLLVPGVDQFLNSNSFVLDQLVA